MKRKTMNIIIGSECDGFTVVIDGKRFHWDQEDDHTILVDIVKTINPEADVEFKEWY